ncbi:MAG: hypothetical protein ACOC0W_07055, partial [Desulfosalsimonas sp.]
MKKLAAGLSVLALAGIFLTGPGCASNADLHRLSTRISELEDQNRELSSSFEEMREELVSGDDSGQNIRQLFAEQDAE